MSNYWTGDNIIGIIGRFLICFYRVFLRILRKRKYFSYENETPKNFHLHQETCLEFDNRVSLRERFFFRENVVETHSIHYNESPYTLICYSNQVVWQPHNFFSNTVSLKKAFRLYKQRYCSKRTQQRSKLFNFKSKSFPIIINSFKFFDIQKTRKKFNDLNIVKNSILNLLNFLSHERKSLQRYT